MDVSIVKCGEYDHELVKKSLIEAISLIGGFDNVSGKKVVLKANLITMLKPEKAGTTHPEIIAALTEILTDRGAKVIIGDSPGGLYNSAYLNRVYTVSNMVLAENYGGKLNQDFSVKEAHNPSGKICKDFIYTGYLDDADMIINVCKLKCHGMMGMSCAVKNMFGAVPGTTKPEYHCRYPNPKDFADAMIDIYGYFKPVLNIVDGIVSMEGNGPTAGTPKDVGLILASRDAYKLDRVCAEIIGISPKDAPIVCQSIERGLAPADIREIECNISVDEVKPTPFKLAVPRSLSFGGEGFMGKIVDRVVDYALKARPDLTDDDCIGCKKCYDVCPVKAITMKDNKPIISKKKCICCFCCQEFCPTGAMKAKRPRIASRLVKISK